mmetsp:Transcript_35134/g.81568  ORF Transcript_35134/g.81568 Transcript_35134/m.81568 type:complete len:384 (-) Transcript_35134:70-1221(-)
MPFRLALLAWLPALVAGMPTFYINLDLPPRKRWTEVATYYRNEIAAMAESLSPIVNKRLGMAREAWLEVAHYDKDVEEEMHGFVEALNYSDISFDRMRLHSLLYEMASPTMACSGVLWAMRNGTVVHGRNMDYDFPFKMPDGRLLNWPDITYQAVFVRGGEPLIKATSWPGAIGFHTAMRIGGWSFEQNTRSGKNEWHENLKAAQQGGQVYSLVVRRVLESVPNFEEAVQQLYSTKFMAPSYFIMSGAGKGEGAVLSIDRLGVHEPSTPPIQRVNLAEWHLVQTNDDLLHEPMDLRRPVANAKLASAAQADATPEQLMQFMKSSPLFNEGTVFTTLMVPATGFYKTLIRDEDVALAPKPVSLIRALRGKRRLQEAITAPGQAD